MKIESRSLIRWACSFVFAFMLAACGGGSSPGNEGAQATSESIQSLSFTPTNMRTASAFAIGQGETLLAFGQIAVDLTRKYLYAGAQLASSETCRNGGVARSSLQDADGNGKASADDTVTISWQDCYAPILGKSFTGDITIAISSASTSSLKVAFKLPQGLIVEGFGQGLTAMFLGSIEIAWSTDDFRTTLKVNSTSADDFRFFAKGSARSATESFKSISLTKDLRFDEARSVISMAMRYESDILGGAMTISTPQPFLAYFNRYPDVGRMEIRGEGESSLVVKANSAIEINSSFVVDFDRNADRISDGRGIYPWNDAGLGFLWADGGPAGPSKEWPYTTEVENSKGFTFFLDYKDVPGVNDFVRIQFSLPITNGDELKFRLRGGGLTYFSGDEYIAVVAEMRGAIYNLRWSAPLRHNREYFVEFSRDGLVWTGVPPVSNVLGYRLAVPDGLAVFKTPHSMEARITTSANMLGPVTSYSAELDATMSSSNRPIASYAWRQVSGPTIKFSTQSSPKTIVQFEGVRDLAFIQYIVVELTITDVDGDVEIAQIQLSI